METNTTTTPVPKITLRKCEFFASFDHASRWLVYADSKLIGYVTRVGSSKDWSVRYSDGFGATDLPAPPESTRKWAVHRVCVRAIGYRGYLGLG